MGVPLEAWIAAKESRYTARNDYVHKVRVTLPYPGRWPLFVEVTGDPFLPDEERRRLVHIVYEKPVVLTPANS